MGKFLKNERGQIPVQILLPLLLLIIAIVLLWYIDRKATDFLIIFIFERVIAFPFASIIFPIILVGLGIFGIKIKSTTLALLYELVDAYVFYKFFQFIR